MPRSKLVYSEIESENEATVVKECKIDQRGEIDRVEAPRRDVPDDSLGKETRQIAPPSRSHPSHVLREKFAEAPLITYRCFHSRLHTVLVAKFPPTIDVPSRDESIIVCIQRSDETEEAIVVDEGAEKRCTLHDGGTVRRSTAGDDRDGARELERGTMIEIVAFEIETTEKVAE